MFIRRFRAVSDLTLLHDSGFPLLNEPSNQVQETKKGDLGLSYSPSRYLACVPAQVILRLQSQVKFVSSSVLDELIETKISQVDQ
jgi:hypothetical protein